MVASRCAAPAPQQYVVVLVQLVFLRVLVARRGDEVEAQEMAREGGTEAVVQVAPQSPPLLFAREHESLERPLKLDGEPVGVQHAAEVAGDILEQAPLAHAQRQRRRPVAHHAHPFTVSDELQLGWVAGRMLAGDSSPQRRGVRPPASPAPATPPPPRRATDRHRCSPADAGRARRAPCRPSKRPNVRRFTARWSRSRRGANETATTAAATHGSQPEPPARNSAPTPAITSAYKPTITADRVSQTSVRFAAVRRS